MRYCFSVICLLLAASLYAQKCDTLAYRLSHCHYQYNRSLATAGKANKPAELWVSNMEGNVYLLGSITNANNKDESSNKCGFPVASYYNITFTDGQVYQYKIPQYLAGKSDITILLKGTDYRYLSTGKHYTNGDEAFCKMLEQKTIASMQYFIKDMSSDKDKLMFEVSLNNNEALKLQQSLKCIL